jgi:CheY-like chemotaxis protein
MSHELRTPFVGIQGYSELLSTTLKEPEEKEMADQILKASKRLTETLNKILNVTRLEFDKLELKITNVDVIELIKSLAILYSKSAEINNTRIKINTPSSPIIIKSDLKLLNEILTNLLNNAVKYTRNGTITISCDTKEFENKNILSIIVADTGVGIPKEKQDVIWQEFRQASEGFNRSFEGTGLGLTIIKKYITALNGTITLDSDIGKGTKFTINLPVIVSDKEPQAYGKIIESENDDSDIPTDNTKTSILYVEDDTIALKYIDKVLSPFYKITTAFSADVAIELVAKFKYDILMLDINLGRGIDGVELMRNIRKKTEYKNTPIVAVTAYAADSDREEFLSKGFSHYISKPFSSTQLKNLLKGIIK